MHRDLAARNILVCEGKRAKIGDFGLSRMADEEVSLFWLAKRRLQEPLLSIQSVHLYDRSIVNRT